MNIAFTDEMRLAGESLVSELDKRNFLVKAALWLVEADRHGWRLIIARPNVHKEGPLKQYKVVQQALAKIRGPLALATILVRDVKDPLIKDLAATIGAGKRVSGTRCSQIAIEGHYVEDAYIYRLAAK